LAIRFFLFLTSLALTCSPGHAQSAIPAPLKHEVRAVWLTTSYGSDWPRSTDRAEQQASLRAIVRFLKSANFNTIFFQVRARGDAYYRSAYEPWAENLTGTPGKDPGWDPLSFLLGEAHEAGMQVHGWVNVFKIRGAEKNGRLAVQHASRTHPEWTITYQGEGWLDPGIPDVRTYVTNVVLDLVRNYELDGINFDYLRYPGNDFTDGESYKRFSAGMNRDEWRKRNLDTFVAQCYDKVTSIRPRIRIGCSPLGIFGADPDFSSQAARAYYQNALGWLRSGKLDYVAPQIYWSIGGSRGDPDFAGLVRAWQTHAAGRHVYAGIGAYKSEVAREIAAQIDSARSSRAAGESYFRYESIRSLTLLGDRYLLPALIPPMPWKDPVPPLAPSHLAVTEVSTTVFQIEWVTPEPAFDGERPDRYVVYRWPSPRIPWDDPRAIVGVTSAGTTVYFDTLRVPTTATYFYAVGALDKLSNESTPSPVSGGTMQEFLALRGKLTKVTALSAMLSPRGGTPHLIAYTLAGKSPVMLDLLKQTGTSGDTTVTTLVNRMQEAGTYVVGLDDIPFTSGMYVVRLRTGESFLEQAFDLSR
jgi:uncharacterized lipoprotein YddW (UPF0748 family)